MDSSKMKLGTQLLSIMGFQKKKKTTVFPFVIYVFLQSNGCND